MYCRCIVLLFSIMMHRLVLFHTMLKLIFIIDKIYKRTIFVIYILKQTAYEYKSGT